MTCIQTNEFSIILTVDKEVTADSLQARTMLGPQRFADGLPHVTLLNNITFPSRELVGSKTMLPIISPILHDLVDHQPGATVQEVVTLSSAAYGGTTSVMVANGPIVTETQMVLAEWLRHTGWHVGEQKTAPHLSLQLGAVASEAALPRIKEVFPNGRRITFTDWLLTRLVLVDNARAFEAVNRQKRR